MPCPRRTAHTTWGMAGSHRCWLTSWKDISLPRGTWQCMCLPKEAGEHGLRLFSSQTAQELSKVLFPPMLIFTSFKSNTNFRTIITLLRFQHLSLYLSIRVLKRQCCTNQYSDVILCSCSYSCIFFPSIHDTSSLSLS